MKSYAANGGDVHTDAIIVASLNFEKGEISLISLPRDTFTEVPGVRGFYKLNCAINCGGGKTQEGFKTSCDTASSLLGGVNISYYMALELESVIKLGDAVGGVDYDMDMDYTGSSSREYQKGFQHLDGTGIYDYLRARTNATEGPEGDPGRMARIQRMMKALFEKFKSGNMLLKLPDIIDTIKNGVYTNISLTQLAALASFASEVESQDLLTYTMSGEMQYIIDWRFAFGDEDTRLDVIRKVYGFNAEPRKHASAEFAAWLDRYGFKALRYIYTAAQVLEYAKDLPQEVRQSAEDKYSEAVSLYDKVSVSLDDTDSQKMNDCMDALRKEVDSLAEMVEYNGNMTWQDETRWYNDRRINEIAVDFN